MFGPEYFTVAGYMGDGFIVCRNCGEAEGSEFTAEESISVASANESFGEDGLYCDVCGEAIVEPPPPYKVMERYTGDSRFYPRWEYETMAEAEEQLKELAEDEPEQFATGKWKLEGPDD
jgi:hypothetical protein